MARGITETEVHDAADALADAGERPTVERIRAHLSTGSPNTVVRHLDSWWGGLRERLQRQRANLSLPDAPEEVGRLAAQWWDLALRAAQERAHAALATDYLTLATERAAVQQAEQDRQAAINELEEALSQARSAETAADQRLADLQLLCDHQKAQLADLAAQRDALITAGQRSDAELAAQVALMQSRDAAATAERLRHVEHLRAAEDRAHAEVDRARQEAQALRKLLDAASRLQLTRDAEQRALETTLRQSISDAQRDAAVAKARADTFAARLPTQAKRTAKGGRPGKDAARATKRAPRAKPTSSR